MGFATTNSLFDKHSDRIEEVINKNIEVFLPSLDPVWRDTVVTSQGVGPADAIGRDMKIIKTYMGSMAGVLEQGAPRDDIGLYGDQTTAAGSKMYLQSLGQTWPDPLNGPNATPYRLGIGMRSMMSNIMFTLGELQAEAMPAFIGEVIAPKLEGFAKNIAHTLCNYWYINQNDQYKLGTISALHDADAAGTSVDSASTGIRVTITEGTYDRFFTGQSVDIIKSNGDFRRNDSGADGSQTPATRIRCFVETVDELKGYVYIRAVSTVGATNATAFHTSGDAAAGTTEVGDVIVYANQATITGVDQASNMAPTGIAGINSWLKGGSGGNDDVLLGAEASGTATEQINVNVHPEFKSFTKSSVGTLTEHKLRQYLRRFHSAKNKYGQYLDCLVASDGVWLAYEATKIGREILDRTGRLSSMSTEGSQEGFNFAFDGRSYKGYTSNYVEDGTVYGLRKGGSNWKRYVPPTPSGYSTFDRNESFIPFNFIAGALTGTGTNKLPIYDSSATGNRSMVTEGVQMPGLLRMQLVPDQPAGMKLTGVSTDQVYSEY